MAEVDGLATFEEVEDDVFALYGVWVCAVWHQWAELVTVGTGRDFQEFGRKFDFVAFVLDPFAKAEQLKVLPSARVKVAAPSGTGLSTIGALRWLSFSGKAGVPSGGSGMKIPLAVSDPGTEVLVGEDLVGDIGEAWISCLEVVDDVVVASMGLIASFAGIPVVVITAVVYIVDETSSASTVIHTWLQLSSSSSSFKRIAQDAHAMSMASHRLDFVVM